MKKQTSHTVNERLYKNHVLIDGDGDATRSNKWLKQVVAPILAASVLIAGCSFNKDDPKNNNNRIDDKAIEIACDSAGITLRDGSSGVVINKAQAGRQYHVNLPQSVVDESMEKSSGNVILSKLDGIVVREGQNIKDAVESIASVDEIACLNGIDPDTKMSVDATVKIPRQTFDKGAQSNFYVVEPGDTYSTIVQKNFPNVNIEDVIINTGTQPTSLLPGEILSIKSTTEDAEINTANTELESFVMQYTDLAQKVEQEYGVPYELTLATAVLESGYGTSELAKNANNFHGMKANNQWDGEIYAKITEEHISSNQLSDYQDTIIGQPEDIGDGKLSIKIQADFKKFDTVEDGFLGYGDYLKNRKINNK